MSTNPPKITIVSLNYSPEPVGIGPFSAELAAGLRDRGHRVSVVAGHPHYPQWKSLDGFGGHDAESAAAGIDIARMRHVVPNGPSLVGRSRMELSFGLRAALADDDADLLFCVSPSLLATSLVLARERLRRNRRPVVTWVQDLYGLGVAETAGAGTAAAKVATWVESRTFRACAGVAVIHERFKQHVVESPGVDPERVAVFRNWSRSERIPSVPRDEALRRLGWDSLADQTVVLHAGSMGRKQGLENVVAAAALADRTPERVTFLLMGDGARRPHLEAAAEGVRSVRFVDVLDDDAFGYALRAADLLLVNQQPGIRDMCVPSKLMSYYSAGRPVLAAVAADGITADEVLGAGAGVVVPAGDPQRLLDQVHALAGDGESRRQMSAAGQAFVNENFDRDSTLDALSAWLDDVADRYARSRR